MTNIYMCGFGQKDSIAKLEKEASFNSSRYVANFKKAQDLYSILISMDPNNKDYYLYRGICYLHFNIFDSAQIDFTSALNLGYNKMKIYSYMSLLCRLRKEYKEALLYINKMIAMKPDSGYLYYDRGGILLTLRDNEAAMNDFKKAAELGDPNAKYLLKRIEETKEKEEKKKKEKEK